MCSSSHRITGEPSDLICQSTVTATLAGYELSWEYGQTVAGKWDVLPAVVLQLSEDRDAATDGGQAIRLGCNEKWFRSSAAQDSQPIVTFARAIEFASNSVAHTAVNLPQNRSGADHGFEVCPERIRLLAHLSRLRGKLPAQRSDLTRPRGKWIVVHQVGPVCGVTIAPPHGYSQTTQQCSQPALRAIKERMECSRASRLGERSAMEAGLLRFITDGSRDRFEGEAAIGRQLSGTLECN
jgi:hypothetical protein